MYKLPEHLREKIVRAFPDSQQLIDSMDYRDNTLATHLGLKRFCNDNESILRGLGSLDNELFNPLKLSALLNKEPSREDLIRTLEKIRDILSDSELSKIIKSAREAVMAEQLLKEIRPHMVE